MEKKGDVTGRNECATRNALISNTPFSRNCIAYPPMHNEIRKEKKTIVCVQFFSARVNLSGRKKMAWSLPTRGDKYFSGIGRDDTKKPHKKPAGNNSKVNWNANNKKKWHKPGEGERRRTKRSGGTRCPFDRSLHSLFLRAPRLREKDEGDEKEREREMTKEGLDCVPISRIFRGTYDSYT